MWARLKNSYPGMAAIITIIASIIVATGWLLDIPSLTSLVPGFTTMKLNAAICFLLVGITLLCITVADFRLIQKISPLLILGIAGATLFEHLAAVDLGIDDWLSSNTSHDEPHPGRMGLAAAFNFVLTSVALTLITYKRYPTAVHLLAFLVMLVAGITLIGEDFSGNISTLLPRYTTMALPAALLFLLVGTSIVYLPSTPAHLLSLEWKLIGGFASVMALTLLSFVVFVRNDREFKNTSEWVDHTYEVLYTCEQIISNVKDIQTGARGYLITGHDVFLFPVYQSLQVVEHDITRLKTLTADNALQKSPIDSLHLLTQKIIAFNKRLITARQQKGPEDAATMVKTQEGENFMHALRTINKKIQDVEKELLTNRRDAASKSARQAESTSRFIGVFTLLTMMLLFVIVQRNTRARNRAEAALLESREWFSTTLSSIGDAVIATDTQGKITFMNQVAQQLTGWKQREAFGIPFDEVFNIVHEATGEQVESPIGKVLAQGIAVELANHTLLKRRDGTALAIDDSAAPIRDVYGNIRGVVLVFRDVTAKKESEKALRESEEKFQTAFHATAAGMTITRLSDTTYVDVNEAFVQLTGYAREELINHSSTDLNLIVSINQREEVLAQIRKHGSARDFEMTIRQKSGKQREVLVSVETIVLKEEKFALNIIYDISQRKEAERQLESTNKELEAFSYSVSHDLRSPLRSILGYAQILEEEAGLNLNPEATQALRIVTQNAKRMNRLIEDLLEFSRLGRKDLIRTSIDCNQIVTTILNDLTAVHTNTEVRMINLPTVQADHMLLTQVWTNLLSNAFKYSAKKDKPVIEITAQTGESEFTFSISDNGAGFDMKYVDKLFGVFQRLHRVQDFEGTGVGLSIVQRIILRHGGRVWAEGKVNEGATFRFTLPR